MTVAHASEQTVTEPSDVTCNVTADIASAYSVTVPKRIVIDAETKRADYTVSVSGDIYGNSELTVIPDNSFVLTSDGKDDVTATVTQDKMLWVQDDMGTVANGTVTAEDLTAGQWAGTFTFHIGIDSHTHEWENGICNGCGTACEHVDANGDGKCDVCVSETDVHTHEYENGVCNGCGTSCTHTDVNGDGACDDCTLETDVHEHDWNDGACTGCGTSCTHTDVNGDGTCDACDFDIMSVGGLFNADGTMICTWEESSIKIDWEQVADDYNPIVTEWNASPNAAFQVLNNTYPDAVKVVVPDDVTSLGFLAFMKCSNIQEVVLPDSCTSISAYAFSECTSLRNVNIPDGVTTLYSETFRNCKALETIYLPSSLKTIKTFNNDGVLESMSLGSPFVGCSDSLKIYCGFASKPSGFIDKWNVRASDETTFTTKYSVTRATYESTYK